MYANLVHVVPILDLGNHAPFPSQCYEQHPCILIPLYRRWFLDLLRNRIASCPNDSTIQYLPSEV